MRHLLLTVASLVAIASFASVNENTEYTVLSDSTFYHDGVYYELIADKDGVPRNALCAYDWDPEIEELSFPDGIDIPEELLDENQENEYIDTPPFSRVGTGETRKYKFITLLKPNHRSHCVFSPEEYKLKKLSLAMDMEVDCDLSVFLHLALVVLPDNMKYIPDYAFKNCKALKSITIKKLIEKIGKEAFAGCSNLGSVRVENSSVLGTIGSSAFEGCTELYNVDLGPLQNIESRAFAGCTSLSSIRLNGYLDHIAKDAFDDCSSLSEFTMIGNDGAYFVSDGALYYRGGYDKPEMWKLFLVPPAKSSITIDINVGIIGDYAFKNNNHISVIYLPDNIEEIGTGAFMGCTQLKKLRLSERLITIPDSCFYRCEKLESLTIPESVRKIDIAALDSCLSLTSVNIPSQVSEIGEGAFGFCTSLETINVSEWNANYASKNGLVYDVRSKNPWTYTPDDIHLVICPAGVKSATLDEETVFIKSGAFKGCIHLTTLHIPEKVWHIEERAFAGCYSLNSFSVDSNNQRYYIIDNVLASSWGSIIACPPGLEEVVLGPLEHPYFLYYVDPYAFYDCPKLKKVTFDTTSLHISGYNFLMCPNIEEVNMINAIAYLDAGHIFDPEVLENATLNIMTDPEMWDDFYGAIESAGLNKFKHINIVDLSGIEEVADNTADSVPYHIEGNSVIIDGNEGKSIKIYDLMGRIVAETTGTSITGLRSGLYILCIGESITCKILIR